MANILPQNIKKKTHKEYHFRLIILIEILLSSLLIFNILLLAPSYIVSLIEEGNKIEQIKNIKEYNATKAVDSREDAILKTKNTLSILSTRDEEIEMSGVVEEVVNASLLGGGIDIIGISYDTIELKKEIQQRVIISGVADTRNDLLSFTQYLEASPHFSGAELPVSNLRAQENIDFSLLVFIDSK